PRVDQQVANSSEAVLFGDLNRGAPKDDFALAEIRPQPALRPHPRRVRESGARAIHEYGNGVSRGPACAYFLYSARLRARLQIGKPGSYDFFGQERDAGKILKTFDARRL